jgi:WD40 repeat protein
MSFPKLIGMLACLTLAASTESKSNESLSGELADRSAKEGLGIATFAQSSQLRFIGLDGSETTIKVPGIEGLYDIDARKQMLLAPTKGLLSAIDAIDAGDLLSPMTASIALFPLSGGKASPTGLKIWPLAAAVSPRLDLIAVLQFTSATSVSLQYGPLDWTAIHEVFSKNLNTDRSGRVEQYASENFSWSPDELSIAYSLNGGVHIFDIQRGEPRRIADGADPSWSPDGHSIAYRSNNKALMIYNVSSGNSQQLTSSFTVIGVPKWSPDSQYILFVDYNPLLALRNLHTLPATRFMVLRVLDRATATVYTPGMGADDRRYFWIRAGNSIPLRNQVVFQIEPDTDAGTGDIDTRKIRDKTHFIDDELDQFRWSQLHSGVTALAKH